MMEKELFLKDWNKNISRSLEAIILLDMVAIFQMKSHRITNRQISINNKIK